MDLLADTLIAAGARGSLGTRIEAGGTWGLWLDSYPGAALHAVTVGTVWLSRPDRCSRRLQAGDLVFLPAGTEHGLSGEPGVRPGACDRAEAARARATGDVVRLGSQPARAKLVTLHYQQDPEVRTPILGALSDVVHIQTLAHPHLDDVVRLLVRELSHPQFGTTAALNSLIDLLLIQVIRTRLDARTEQRAGWLSGLLDPPVRDALTKIHQEPSRPWTTATLAAAISVSRATLSRRFPAATGQTPGDYLTRWRMDLAALRLRDTDQTVESIATAVGYTSAQAFSRAFRRHRGLAPGAYRGRSRHG
ncbi:cupin domain-containing protein [Streptomyces sp. NPDC002701]|uniref:AraC family transcriptional regulator n=1 Tax=Streptomyces sp. NPDC002701 TaxID=3364661 RepID=UPI00368886C8